MFKALEKYCSFIQKIRHLLSLHCIKVIPNQCFREKNAFQKGEKPAQILWHLNRGSYGFTDGVTREYDYEWMFNLYKERKYAFTTLGKLLFGQLNNFINRCFRICDVTTFAILIQICFKSMIAFYNYFILFWQPQPAQAPLILFLNTNNAEIVDFSNFLSVNSTLLAFRNYPVHLL